MKAGIEGRGAGEGLADLEQGTDREIGMRRAASGADESRLSHPGTVEGPGHGVNDFMQLLHDRPPVFHREHKGRTIGRWKVRFVRKSGNGRNRNSFTTEARRTRRTTY